ncbi:MAG TPA: cation-translocating P-type ATPase [Candidatus Kapabacteria bacterium]|nr:cation-translocating P-type ATPase [Candidatus Kapabacteria bacterium]
MEQPEIAEQHHVAKADLIRIGFVALAALAVWLRVWEPFAKVSIIGILSTAIGGWPIWKEAFENLRQKRMTMELSMTIALVAALVIGQFFTALVIMFFVLGAEVLEGLTVGRGRNAIKDLMSLMPREAVLRTAEGDRTVPIEQLNPGDEVLIKPGAALPVDGVVVSGISSVDQSAITGESIPAEKSEGAPVFAGTVNQSGALVVRTESIGRDTAYGKIVETVEHAEQVRAPIQKTADRFAGYLVYFALACAALTFIITHDARSTISVIIVAGACGIAAGTPLAVLGAIGRAARHGSIIKGGIYLEALGNIDTVVFDKTGTLTEGTPRVTHVYPAFGKFPEEVVEAAAICEKNSEHPLAGAVLSKAAELHIAVVTPDHFHYATGRGVACAVGASKIVVGNRQWLGENGIVASTGHEDADSTGALYVGKDGNLLGTIDVKDVARPESRTAIQALRRMGLRTVLLTGDAASVAKELQSELEFDAVHAELLPNQKAEAIARMRSEGRNIAMVGDGINDAPALMQANVGVAMGSGTDVARESADVVLIGNDLLKFVETVKIARWCRTIIRENFIGTLTVDGIGVGLAAFGMLSPLLAALIHVSSELIFILNSTRLLPPRRKNV